MMKKAFLTLCILSCILINSFGQVKESLQIAWPGEYKWKVGAQQDTKAMSMIELIPEKQSLTNWSVMATMVSYKNMKMPISKVPALMMASIQKNATSSKLTIEEQGVKNGAPWILFKIESPSFKNDPRPESQLYYAIQGKATLYVNFVAMKSKIFPSVYSFKFTRVFKASQIITK
jgi:hypothetical protein